MNTLNKIFVSVILAVFVLLSVWIAIMYVPKNTEKPAMEVTEEDDSAVSEDFEKDRNLDENFTAIAYRPVSKLSVAQESQKPETKSVSFAAVGDIIVHTTVLSDARDKASDTDKEYNFSPMFDKVSDIIGQVDFAYINQEAPIAGKNRGYSGYPLFNSPGEVVYDLKDAGFNIFNVANNHMLDKHTSGYASTIEFFKSLEDVTYIGGYTDEEDYNNIRIVEKDGITIALLAYTYGTNGMTLERGSELVVPLSIDSEIDRQTAKARELADIVMVSIHWGAEHWSDSFLPTSEQKRQMQIMVNNGVDVIIGSHPHALEPMFWQDRPDGGKTLVMYSLGNFLSGMEYMRNHLGGIMGFDLVKMGDKAYVQNPYFIPTVCHFDSRVRNFEIYRLSEYTDELLLKHGTQVRGTDTRRSVKYLKSIIDSTISPEFLIEDFYKTEEAE